jgi:hypothetical protein
MRLKNEHARLLGCVAALCATPGLTYAQSADADLYWSLRGGLEYTDNAGRSGVDEQSETVGIAGFSLGLNTDRPRLDAGVDANLEYREYLDNTFDSEVVGGVDGLASYAFIPERFIWVLTDNFAQIANDRSVADSPDNRQNVNYLSTGPDITVPVGARSYVRLSGRYSDTYYEVSDADHEGLTGSLALARRLSDITEVSLNGSTTKVEYDDEAFAEYTLDQAFLRWSTVSERTTFIVDGGYNVVEQGDEESGGMLARLEVSRAVTSRSRLGLSAGTEFATAGQGLRLDQELTGIETGADDAVAVSDPYQLNYAYVTWTTDRDRSAFSIALNARSEDHEVQTLEDRDIYGATATFSRQLARRLDGTLTGSYDKEELVNTGFEFDEWSVRVGLNWLLGERVSLNLRLEHFEGSSEDGTRDYDENRAFLGIVYSRSGT